MGAFHTTAAGSASGFQMQFAFNSSSELNTIFLIAPALNSTVATPPLRVLLIVTVNGLPTPLFDGVVTRIQVQPGQDGSLIPQVGDLASLKVDENNIEVRVSLESEVNGNWKGTIISYYTEVRGRNPSERLDEIKRN